MNMTDEYRTIEAAAASTGIAARTIRYWVSSGKLSATTEKRGKRVSLRDVESLGQLTGRINGNGHTVKDTVPESKTATETVAINQAAQSQLEAIRDQWLAPLIDRIGELEHLNGRLEERVEHVTASYDTVTVERDVLKARLSEVEEQRVSQSLPEEETPRIELQRPWWRFWKD